MKKRGPRPLARSAVKERILGSLVEQLESEGYFSLSVDEIVSSLGMSKKTFYRVFRSREELFSYLVDRMTERTGRQIVAIVSSDQSFVLKMQDLLRFVSFIWRRVDSGLMRELYKQMPHLWKRIEEFRRKKITENITRLLRQGIDEGYVRPDLDLGLFLRIHLAAVEAVVRPHGLTNETLSPEETIQRLILILFTGILTDTGKGELCRMTSLSTRNS